jgi:hypothetical protein
VWGSGYLVWQTVVELLVQGLPWGAAAGHTHQPAGTPGSSAHPHNGGRRNINANRFGQRAERQAKRKAGADTSYDAHFAL